MWLLKYSPNQKRVLDYFMWVRITSYKGLSRTNLKHQPKTWPTLGVFCMRSHSRILLGTFLFVRNVILITKVKKIRNRLRIHRLSSIFCLSHEDRKKISFFGFWEKSLIDRISCFSINMAHMILNPYQKKYLSTKLYFWPKYQKSDLHISNNFFFSKSTVDSPAMIWYVNKVCT